MELHNKLPNQAVLVSRFITGVREAMCGQSNRKQQLARWRLLHECFVRNQRFMYCALLGYCEPAFLASGEEVEIYMAYIEICKQSQETWAMEHPDAPADATPGIHRVSLLFAMFSWDLFFFHYLYLKCLDLRDGEFPYPLRKGM